MIFKKRENIHKNNFKQKVITSPQILITIDLRKNNILK